MTTKSGSAIDEDTEALAGSRLSTNLIILTSSTALTLESLDISDDFHYPKPQLTEETIRISLYALDRELFMIVRGSLESKAKNDFKSFLQRHANIFA